MSRLVLIVVCLLVGAANGRGADSFSLAAARRAQAELGPEIWSEVIRIENAAVLSAYPRTVHALVFELAGILWFYTASDGTQSLSLRRGRGAEDKADLSPLLRAIEPGFARWRVVPEGPGLPARTPRDDLPNGCFIDSVAVLRTRRERGDPAPGAQLLSYYINTSDGCRGHTVLTYATDSGIAVIDPAKPGSTRKFPAAVAADALSLAREIGGDHVVRARWLPFDLATSPSAPVAGGAPAPGDPPADLAAG